MITSVFRAVTAIKDISDKIRTKSSLYMALALVIALLMLTPHTVRAEFVFPAVGGSGGASSYNLVTAFAPPPLPTIQPIPQKQLGAATVPVTTKQIFSTPAQLVNTRKAEGKPATEIVRELQTAFKVTLSDAAALMKAAGYPADQVALALNDVFKLSDASGKLTQKSMSLLVDVLKAAGYPSTAIAIVLNGQFAVSQKEALVTLKNAGFIIADIYNAMVSVFAAQSLVERGQILVVIGYLPDQIVDYVFHEVISDPLNRRASDLLKVGLLNGAGFSSDSVAVLMRKYMNSPIKDVAVKLLRVGSGYSLDQTTTALKNVFQATPQDVATVLKDLSRTADVITITLKNVFQVTPHAAAIALKTAGYAANEVAGTLKTVFVATPQVTASALATAGYLVAEVTGALKNVLNATVQVAAESLRAAGYAATQASGALIAGGYPAAAVATAVQSAYATP